MSGGSGSTAATDETTDDDAQAQQEQVAAQDQATTQQSTRRTRTASSSTKVDFTSEVSTVVPSVTSLNEGSTFPWALVFGGLGALGIAVYFAARAMNRRQK